MTELTCRNLVELVSDYLEGALSPQDRARFDRHLAGCTNCTEYVEQFRETIRLTGTLRESDVSPEAKAVLLAQVESWKRGV
jgi:anti-sigma factor RsiW